jgi:hypothetical protein
MQYRRRRAGEAPGGSAPRRCESSHRCCRLGMMAVTAPARSRCDWTTSRRGYVDPADAHAPRGGRACPPKGISKIGGFFSGGSTEFFSIFWGDRAHIRGDVGVCGFSSGAGELCHGLARQRGRSLPVLRTCDLPQGAVALPCLSARRHEVSPGRLALRLALPWRLEPRHVGRGGSAQKTSQAVLFGTRGRQMYSLQSSDLHS